MNHEIKQKTTLLTPNGQLQEAGYATRMHFIYNREAAKLGPMPLKEWNFYQFQCENYVLQMTLGHLSYIGQMAVTLMDINTGEKHTYSTMKPLFIPELDRNPEAPSTCEYKNEECHLKFTVTDDKRILSLKGHSRDYDSIDVELVVENDPYNEKMVIATPFTKPHQFYLNYKENYYTANGSIRFGQKHVLFQNATGLLDWGRGVWPYKHEWYWGSLTSHIDGVPFAFNIGWGFGDTSRATENMYFYNKKAYKVGKLHVEWDDNNLLAVKHFHDPENKIQFTFTPFYDNFTFNEFLVVDTHCHQIFGYFSGTIETDEGPKHFKDVPAFIEHAINRW